MQPEWVEGDVVMGGGQSWDVLGHEMEQNPG